MTQPDPPSTGTVARAYNNIIGMDRRILFGIVIAGGVVAYLMLRKPSSSIDDANNDSDSSTSWRQRASDILKQRGYSNAQINSALGHYLDGGTMSPQDTDLITAVMGTIGRPGIPNADPSYQSGSVITNPGPAAPRAGNQSTYDGGVGNVTNEQDITDGNADTVQTYWYVPSLGVGYSASYRGLAAQFYGNEQLATAILAANPGGPNTVFGRITPGTITKVPRSVKT